MKLNTKMWSKVESHKEYTRFRDSKGNELKVAHKHLTPKYRKEIDELPIYMAEGGEVKPKDDKGPPEINKKDAEAFSKGFNTPVSIGEMAGNIKKAMGFADGGEVDPLAAENSSQAPYNAADALVQSAQAAPVRPEYEALLKGEQDKGVRPSFLDPSKPEDKALKSLSELDALRSAAPGSLNQLDMAQRSSLEASALPASPAANAGSPPASSSLAVASEPPPQGGLAGIAAQAGAAPGGSDPLGTGQMLASYQGGLKEQIGGIQQQAKAESDLAKQQLALQNQAVAVQQGFQSEWEKKSAALQGSIDNATAAYASGKIDPERFVSNMGTGDRFATAIGLILGGMGAGVTGGENQALGLLKMRINNDVDAQRSEMTKRENLVGMAYKQFGNMKDAMEYSRAMQMNILATQLNAAAAKAGDPLAAARGKQAEGLLRTQSAQMIGQLSRQQALMSIMSKVSQDPNYAQAALPVIRQIDPEKAKELEGRLVPGVGVGSVPVPEKVREQLIAQKNFSVAVQDLQKWTKTHSTILPGTKDYNIGEQKALELQTLIREGLLNTVYREGEQPLLDKLLHGNPANLLKNFNTIPQLKELMRSNDAKSAALKSTYGLPVGPSAEQVDNQKQAQYLQWAKANPNDPRAKRILNQGN